MRTRKLFGVFFLTVGLMLSAFTSCKEDEFEPYKEVLTIGSETVVTDAGIAYWVKRDVGSSWEMMHTEIANFNHEKGYEYVVEVSVKKRKEIGPDQSSHLYTLIRIISKIKKDSDIPPLTTTLI